MVYDKGAKWWRLFTVFKIPTFICFDNDVRSKDDDNQSRRKDALKAIGIPESELDGVLSIEDWNISDKFCVFGTDFEETMRGSFEDYLEIEERKKVEFGTSSKHIIAREVAKEVNMDDGGVVGVKRLNELIERIKVIASIQTGEAEQAVEAAQAVTPEESAEPEAPDVTDETAGLDDDLPF